MEGQSATARHTSGGTEQALLMSKLASPSFDASRRVLQIAEREVGRIILDIHDGPVQNIFAALSNLYVTQRRLTQSLGTECDEDLERIKRSIMLLEHSLNEIRTFMGAFRPPEFERRSLLAVIEGLVIQHEEMTGNTVELLVQNRLPEVSLPVKISLYRILQEALSNASRHSHSDRHTVVLASDGENIKMEVHDEGRGFDPKAVINGSDGSHIGLEGMRERVAVLGGQFAISSTPGHGTHVRVIVPRE
jgi:signal transduction histidine kinase